MSENRCYTRHDQKLGISYDYKSTTYSEETLNISVGGFCIMSEKEVKKGQHLTVNVNLQNTDNVELNATVAWCKPIANDGKQFLLGLEILDKVSPGFEDFYHYHCQYISNN